MRVPANSWATERPKKVLGEVEIPKRVRYSQGAVYVGMIVAIVFSQLTYNPSNPDQPLNPVYFSAFVCALAVTWVGNSMVLYKNTSFSILRKLVREPNVWQIAILCIGLLILDGFGSTASMFRSFAYVLGLVMLVLLDAVEKKSRMFVLSAGAVYTLLTIYHVLIRAFAMPGENIVIFVVLEKYEMNLRSLKRSIFMNQLTLMLSGLITLFADKKMEKLMFCTKHEFNLNLNHVKEDEQRRHKIAKCMIALGSILFIGIFLSRLQETSVLFGGLYASGLVCIWCGFMLLGYRNLSSKSLRRLGSEVSVVTVCIFLLMIFVVDVSVLEHPIDIVSSLGYVTCGLSFISMDAFIKRQRALTIVVGTCFVAVTLYNIYGRVFGSTEEGLVLIKPFGHIIYKRDVKRSLFVNIGSLLLSGVITLFRDSRRERFMFVKGPVYRLTGEVSLQRQSQLYVASRTKSAINIKQINDAEGGPAVALTSVAVAVK